MPCRNRERTPRAFSEQDEADVWFGEPIVNGDRATCEYWGVVSFQGRDETIAGVAVIRFDADGLVSDQRDYWNAEEGRREPLEGWARPRWAGARRARRPAGCRRARVIASRALRGRPEMRGHDDVVELEQLGRDVRLVREDVEPGAEPAETSSATSAGSSTT